MIHEALLYEPRDDESVDCFLCSHRCHISSGRFGVCGMRQNRQGRLYTHAYGEAVAAHVDPIEKKPLFHVLPGSRAFSVAAPGCNFRCGFCQNWQISQVSREHPGGPPGQPLPPQDIVRRALETGCASIAYTYTEPTIFFEYALDTAKLARDEGLLNVFVTNGYMTKQAIEKIAPLLDACNVDLKSYREDFYARICGGSLKPVLESIRCMKRRDIWVEVTTLLIPGVNDSESELTGLARFIAAIDPSMPWHVSRFHPDYQFTEAAVTPLKSLEQAREIGIGEGLRHVYIGNVIRDQEDTLCEHCNNTVIRRQAFMVRENSLNGAQCPYCGRPLSGIFKSPLNGIVKISRPAEHVETRLH